MLASFLKKQLPSLNRICFIKLSLINFFTFFLFEVYKSFTSGYGYSNPANNSEKIYSPSINEKT